MDLLVEKSIFLKRFEQVTDIELIKALNVLLEYTLPHQKQQDTELIEQLTDEYELSEEHKQILEERLLSYKKNPENTLSWEEVKQKLNAK